MNAEFEPPRRGRILDPIDRNSEILFGLFMVLSFTGTLSAATAGREDVRTMLIAAIGCNAAWGFVDGVMYVLRSVVARGREAALARAVRDAGRPEDAHRLIAHGLGTLAEAFGPAELERARQRLSTIGASADTRPRVEAHDLRAAVAIFLLVFVSTFPVVLPYVFVDDLWAAKRLSGAVAIAMLFLCGYTWGRYAGLRPRRTGLAMVLMGTTIEAVVIALGG